MRQYLCLTWLLVTCISTWAQNPATVSLNRRVAGSGSTYALVIGISSYEKSGVRDLKFAHKDAQEFADYLKSKAGGSVPAANIRLLVNQEATIANIYNALSWLEGVCQKGDRVYFYYAGHGDVETQTIYNLGFLLAYDTPNQNYIRNALRIEDLNNLANTLSVNKEVNVILITDACRSGKLAGSENRGTSLVGAQLEKVQKKEVRITSCQSDELSVENERWGGGRGVFSYYLIQGLKGLADSQGDGTVSLQELTQYLNSKVPVDVPLVDPEKTQNPVIQGNPAFRLAVVDATTLNDLKNQNSKPAPVPPAGTAVESRSVETDVSADQEVSSELSLIHQLTQEQILKGLDYGSLAQAGKDSLVTRFLQQAMTGLSREEDRLEAAQWLEHARTSAEERQQLAFKLSAALHDQAQHFVNLYLEADAAELEKRRYYNARNSGYGQVAHFLDFALSLLPADHPLCPLLQVKRHYFAAVAARMQILLVEDQTKWIRLAQDELQKALNLEPQAAYLHQELGVIRQYQGQMKQAEAEYREAIRLSPTWAIPWSYLSRLHAIKGEYSRGLDAAARAEKLQPNLLNAKLSAALNHELSGNYLRAEELYREGIRLNSKHYYPYERMGFTCLQTARLGSADSFFALSSIRLEGFVPNISLDGYPGVMDAQPRPWNYTDSLFFETAGQKPLGEDDLLFCFSLAKQAYEADDAKNAEVYFRKVARLDPSDPLAFHYLGKLAFEQSRWQQAELYFRLAHQYALPMEALRAHWMALKKTRPDSTLYYETDEAYLDSHYPTEEDDYFLFKVYQVLGHQDKAEQICRRIIRDQPESLAGYHLLATLQESGERYAEAEATYLSYGSRQQEQGESELFAFYKRMIQRQQQVPDWYLKAGLLMYRIASDMMRTPELDFGEVIETDPDSTDRGFGDYPPQVYQSEAKVIIPGIQETFVPEPPILTPRQHGVHYLQQAVAYETNPLLIADLHKKTGDLYLMAGSIPFGSQYYQRSIDARDEDAGTEEVLAELYHVQFLFSPSKALLDTLERQGRICFSSAMLLSKYRVHSGQLSAADSLLHHLEGYLPYKEPGILRLQALGLSLKKRYPDAIATYQSYMKAFGWNVETQYLVARLQELHGDHAGARKSLARALKEGFSYEEVLKHDPAWEKMRKDGSLDKLRQQ